MSFLPTFSATLALLRLAAPPITPHAVVAPLLRLLSERLDLVDAGGDYSDTGAEPELLTGTAANLTGNLVALLSHLFNFRVVHASALFPVLRRLLAGSFPDAASDATSAADALDTSRDSRDSRGSHSAGGAAKQSSIPCVNPIGQRHLQLLMQLLRNSGPGIRNADPAAFAAFRADAQRAVAAVFASWASTPAAADMTSGVASAGSGTNPVAPSASAPSASGANLPPFRVRFLLDMVAEMAGGIDRRAASKLGEWAPVQALHTAISKETDAARRGAGGAQVASVADLSQLDFHKYVSADFSGLEFLASPEDLMLLSEQNETVDDALMRGLGLFNTHAQEPAIVAETHTNARLSADRISPEKLLDAASDALGLHFERDKAVYRAVASASNPAAAATAALAAGPASSAVKVLFSAATRTKNYDDVAAATLLRVMGSQRSRRDVDPRYDVLNLFRDFFKSLGSAHGPSASTVSNTACLLARLIVGTQSGSSLPWAALRPIVSQPGSGAEPKLKETSALTRVFLVMFSAALLHGSAQRLGQPTVWVRAVGPAAANDAASALDSRATAAVLQSLDVLASERPRKPGVSASDHARKEHDRVALKDSVSSVFGQTARLVEKASAKGKDAASSAERQALRVASKTFGANHIDLFVNRLRLAERRLM
jgi:hypothetical protein